jgi:hypothetical protein
MAKADLSPTVGGQEDSSKHLASSEDGVDLTLIRWMLSLTPAERLEVLQNTVASILRLRGDQT